VEDGRMKFGMVVKPVLALISAALLMLAIGACGPTQREKDKQAAQARADKAEAMFQERCKTAGEKITRTVDNVEGITLMKLRPNEINYGDQFALTDPYGFDSGGDTYIKTFFGKFYRSSPHNGYRYIEAIDPNDGQRYRYTGSIRDVTHTASILMGGDGKTKFVTKDFVLDKLPAVGESPRYGVTYDDLSTHEEREYWIAGSSLKVIDLKTNEVIAERIGYMMDRGQGEKGGGRSPWLYAADHACPGFQRNPNLPISSGHGASAQQIQTEDFVEKVLKPTLEK
jgi:hypothetical protein